MRTRILRAENPRRSALVPLLLLLAGIALPGCHPGNAAAKQLRRACEAGTATACHEFALKLLTAEYVLRDVTRAATLFDRACTAGVAEACARLGVQYQSGNGVERDSSRALSEVGW